MATTLGKITEQVQRIINGGEIQADNLITFDEIKTIVCQICNKILKMERFSVNMPEGDFGVPHAAIATYDGVAVTAYKNTAQSKLPAFPISLPKNMGVWSIAPVDDPYNLFIPIPSGTFGLMKKIDFESTLLGNIGYEVDGQNVIYVSDIRSAPLSITAVTIKLLVTNINNLGDYDILPIPSDMEYDVITQAVQLLTAYQPSDDSLNNNSKK
jgi:hypothetical protein